MFMEDGKSVYDNGSEFCYYVGALLPTVAERLGCLPTILATAGEDLGCVPVNLVTVIIIRKAEQFMHPPGILMGHHVALACDFTQRTKP